jgi:hypothetical protein
MLALDQGSNQPPYETEVCGRLVRDCALSGVPSLGQFVSARAAEIRLIRTRTLTNELQYDRELAQRRGRVDYLSRTPLPHVELL